MSVITTDRGPLYWGCAPGVTIGVNSQHIAEAAILALSVWVGWSEIAPGFQTTVTREDEERRPGIWLTITVTRHHDASREIAADVVWGSSGTKYTNRIALRFDDSIGRCMVLEGTSFA